MVGRKRQARDGCAGFYRVLQLAAGRIPHVDGSALARRIAAAGHLFPVAANGKVYLTSRDGVTVVIEDTGELKIVATNRVDEGVDATPAIAGREIFIRSQRHLYCFSEE